MSGIIPIERIEEKIFLIRRKKVMLDADLASIYGVTTKRLGEQVKRNSARFPEDFMFLLTKEEKDELVANCDRLKNSNIPVRCPRHLRNTGRSCSRMFSKATSPYRLAYK